MVKMWLLRRSIQKAQKLRILWTAHLSYRFKLLAFVPNRQPAQTVQHSSMPHVQHKIPLSWRDVRNGWTTESQRPRTVNVSNSFKVWIGLIRCHRIKISEVRNWREKVKCYNYKWHKWRYKIARRLWTRPETRSTIEIVSESNIGWDYSWRALAYYKVR